MKTDSHTNKCDGWTRSMIDYERQCVKEISEKRAIHESLSNMYHIWVNCVCDYMGKESYSRDTSMTIAVKWMLCNIQVTSVTWQQASQVTSAA